MESTLHLSSLRRFLDWFISLTSCDSILTEGRSGGQRGLGECAPKITHADGRLVSRSAPAEPSETLIVYLTGLGFVVPIIPAGTASPSPPPQAFGAIISFSYGGAGGVTRSSGDAMIDFTGLTPGEVGLYQINFRLPAFSDSLPACQEPFHPNVTIHIAAWASWDDAGICARSGSNKTTQ